MTGETYYLFPQKRNKSKGSDVWYGGIASNGKTRWVSLRTKNEKVAKEWYNKMQARRWLPPEHAAPPAVSLGAAENAFLLDIENVRRRVAGTVKLYRIYLAQFKSYCGRSGISDMGSITPAVCSEFARQAFSGISAATAKSKTVLLRSFFSWAAEHYNLAGKNPFKKIVAPKSQPAPRKFWTVEQCEKIIAAAPGEECRCYFALMAFAGLRREEARLLKMENLAEGKISLTGKGGKHASVPISTKLQAYIGKYLAMRGHEPGLLFPRLGSLSTFKEDKIKTAAEKSGIEIDEPVNVHRFRHSFASNLLRAGRSIKAVQMLMRHENVTLTLNIYGHLLPSDLEQAAEL